MSSSSKQRLLLVGLCGVFVGFALMIALGSAYVRSSTNDSCMSCHVHPQAEESWVRGNHHNSRSGAMTDCAACHLPPEGTAAHFRAKLKIGLKDLWSYVFKDHDKINWERKRELEYAQRIVYNESCKSCHVNLFPEGMPDEGVKAHIYYELNEESKKLQCISCHLDAGHQLPGFKHTAMTGVPVIASASGLYSEPARLTEFADYTETVPGTAAAIRMIAVPGGTFVMGSPEDEPFRRDDEGPQRRVTVSDFFMAEVEVTWDQYWSFYSETMSEGHTPPEKVYANNERPDVDAVSGPTPPFGSPDQGWGMGSRPAITMTWYAAKTFCQWLSLKTGRTYRLPTEAEWEYAARGGSQTAYCFPGNPKKYSSKGFLRGLFKPDTTYMASHAIYALNSDGQTAEPSAVLPNPFGLKNMYGNVMEYCEDNYSAKAYSQLEDGAVNPCKVTGGKEHVVRGGCYADDASELRSAARGRTWHNDWLKTDPQNPKSIWWYSDVKGIGFRVVCEVPDDIRKTK